MTQLMKTTTQSWMSTSNNNQMEKITKIKALLTLYNQ